MKVLSNIFNAKIRLLLGGVILVTLIATTQISQSGMKCESVVVNINNSMENYFLDENDILQISTNNGIDPLEGAEIEKIDLKGIEKRLNDNPYIIRSQIYKDLKGRLIISVDLKRPLARIVRQGALDAYITDQGDFMPVSDKYVSRVMLVSGAFADTLHLSSGIIESPGSSYFDLISHINNDEFLKAQVAELIIKRDGKVDLIPQVTKQRIEFGQPERIENKFRKLKIFYRDILPREGWNKYSKVNLEFDQQIITE